MQVVSLTSVLSLSFLLGAASGDLFWYYQDGLDVHNEATWPPCVPPAISADIKETSRWWFGVDPVTSADAGGMLLRLQPKLIIPEALTVCPPFNAIDNEGRISSGIDPGWTTSPQMLCRVDSANTRPKQA